jgi:hypothetical protein
LSGGKGLACEFLAGVERPAVAGIVKRPARNSRAEKVQIE